MARWGRGIHAKSSLFCMYAFEAHFGMVKKYNLANHVPAPLGCTIEKRLEYKNGLDSISDAFSII
jgi:hypothetical protein